MIRNPRECFIACQLAVAAKLDSIPGRDRALIELAKLASQYGGSLEVNREEIERMLSMTLREIASLDAEGGAS